MYRPSFVPSASSAGASPSAIASVTESGSAGAPSPPSAVAATLSLSPPSCPCSSLLSVVAMAGPASVPPSLGPALSSGSMAGGGTGTSVDSVGSLAYIPPAHTRKGVSCGRRSNPERQSGEEDMVPRILDVVKGKTQAITQTLSPPGRPHRFPRRNIGIITSEQYQARPHQPLSHLNPPPKAHRISLRHFPVVVYRSTIGHL